MSTRPTLDKHISLSHYMIDVDSLHLVLPGEMITSEEGFMTGHGTYKLEDKLYASVMGTIEVTNKLISVKPIQMVYTPQIGDIVVGRVVEIANKRWKIDINAAAFSFLPLSSTYIPEQRKKNEDDEFNMRRNMQQGDYIVAEVHSVNQDKTYNLHTRNPKYGKLEPGVIVKLQHNQVKKQKHHLISVGAVGVILGNNGNIYLSHLRRNLKNQGVNSQEGIQTQKQSKGEMEEVSLLRNMLEVLKSERLQVSQSMLVELAEWATTHSISAKSILNPEGQFRAELLKRLRTSIPQKLQQRVL